MSIGAKEHAQLAEDSYEDRSAYVGKDKFVTLAGTAYRVIDTYNGPATGYQGTAYRREDTGEVIIAHRGTEKDFRDIAIDGGMVLTGLNAQIPDAERFTARVLNTLEKEAEEKRLPFDPTKVTVTGHSLGGTMAEYIAYKFHLHGETFNAYGAAGLMHGVPEGGSQVVNYARATDVVSAASKHYGEVRVLATSEDIDRLHDARYHEDGTGFWRNTVGAIDLGAHGIANFVPDAQGHSALDTENAARYRAHRAMIDRYRDDVLIARTAISARWELEKKAAELGQAAGKATVETVMATSRAVGQAAVQGVHAVAYTAEQVGRQVAHGAQQAAYTVSISYDATLDVAVQGTTKVEQSAMHVVQTASREAQQIGQSAMQTAKVLGQQASLVGAMMSDGLTHMGQTLRHPGALFDRASAPPVAAPIHLDDPTHAAYPLFQQCMDGVQQLNTKHGAPPNAERDANLSGALTVAAVAQGLGRIDHVVLSDNARYAFATRDHHVGEPLDRWAARVDTVQAMNTPLEQSSVRWSQAAQQAQQLQEQQLQTQQRAQQRATGMSL